MAEKTDFKRELDCYRARRGAIRRLDVPPLQYLMIDGTGDPNGSPDFAGAIEALYSLAYKLKFFSKNELGRDYVVMPLEGLWWAPEMSAFTTHRDKSGWNWTLMIMVPSWITAEHFGAVRNALAAKATTAARDGVRLELLEEGPCVQTPHVGPFDAEGPVIERLHAAALSEPGAVLRGRHHEIYLSDFRRTVPARRRTVLRHPVTPG